LSNGSYVPITLVYSSIEVRMAVELPEPEFMPCPDCGGSVSRADRGEHQCEQERVLDYSIVRLRPELEGLEEEIESYLKTPQGRFEAWYAARRRAA
jgi:hypothetical protein